ncbi:Crp/Fnr family transcriptional regulator [Actinomycetospora termitidis]|uniref:Crp/Fnr family transcriptional regulator n=1 Tax=Actinomycetospora termitidis TaxID=3053470 RepID=A0ABT7M9L7_9PSEU|nr:Crp/Fnr family transcriptional regulator [Actinomycetospora sp. Odt1-22]MDL5156497.1 Crp/Fnr family transcriptional regulator [Actinomycetospora sp. Odt1-22]
MSRPLPSPVPVATPELAVSPFLLAETGPVAARLAALGVSRRLRAGEVVMRQGELSGSLFVLTAGRLRLSLLRPDGGERVLGYAEPGASVGETACVDRAARAATAVAVVDSEVLAVTRESLLAAARSDPELLLEVARRVAHKQHVLHLHLALDALPARERMVLLLSHLVDAHGEPGPDGLVRLRLQLAVDDLAAIVGLTRVTASRELSRLVAEGVLLKQRRSFVVRDRPALRRLTASVAV